MRSQKLFSEEGYMPSSCRLPDYWGEQQTKNLAPTVTFTKIQDKNDIPSCHSSSDSPDNSEEQMLPAHTDVIVYLLEITDASSAYRCSYISVRDNKILPAHTDFIYLLEITDNSSPYRCYCISVRDNKILPAHFPLDGQV